MMHFMHKSLSSTHVELYCCTIIFYPGHYSVLLKALYHSFRRSCTLHLGRLDRLNTYYLSDLLMSFCFTLLSSFMPGNFSCGDNSSYPVVCSAGSYAPAGSIKCQSCPKRAYCPTNGLSSYVLCANGTYSNSEGLRDCIPCDAGFKCPSVGMELPEECPNGTYSNATGARYCVACPEGHR